MKINLFIIICIFSLIFPSLVLADDAQDFKAATQSVLKALIDQDNDKLESLLKQRKQIFLRLLDNDEGKSARKFFQDNVIPSGLRSRAPVQMQELFEREVQASGKVTQAIFEPETLRGHSQEKYFLQEDHGGVELHGAKFDLYSDVDVQISGVKIDNHLIVNKVEPVLTANIFPPSSSAHLLVGSLAMRKVAVILFNFLDNTLQSVTPEQAMASIFTGPYSANLYYQENSLNQLGLGGYVNPQGDVFGWITIPYNQDNCTYDYSWASFAQQILITQQGFDPSQYDHFIYVRPPTPLCNSTWAEIGGNESWLSGGLYLATHELGHNLGQYHANGYNCVDGTNHRVAISNSCTSAEYGDPFDVMGSLGPYKHMNAYEKSRMNWFVPQNIQDVTAEGIYTIAPIEQSSGEVQVLRIPRDRTASGIILKYYYLEFRQPYGFENIPPDQSGNLFNGVTIHLAPPPVYYPFANSNLIDTRPVSSTFDDAPLEAGRTFSDPGYNLFVTTLDVSPERATIQVSFSPPSCTRENPIITMSPSFQTGSRGDILVYNLTITNADSVGCQPSTFSLASSVPPGWRHALGVESIDLAPGTSATVPLTVRSNATAMTDFHTISASVTNLSTNLSQTEWGIYSLQVNDLTPPDVHIRRVTDNMIIYINDTVIVKAVANDNVGVNMMRIFIDGQLRQSCPDAVRCSYPLDLSGLTSGPHTITAVAVDTSYNIGTHQVTIFRP